MPRGSWPTQNIIHAILCVFFCWWLWFFFFNYCGFFVCFDFYILRFVFEGEREEEHEVGWVGGGKELGEGKEYDQKDKYEKVLYEKINKK